MERSSDVLELLDEELDDPDALDGNLRDLRRVNRWLGGVALSAAAIEALAAGGDPVVARRRRHRRGRHPGGAP